MAGSAFLSIKPGSLISADGRRFQVTRVLSLDSVLAEDLKTREPERLRIDRIRPEIGPVVQEAARDLGTVADEDWAEAQRRFEAIKSLLNDPVRTRHQAEATAQNAGVHVSTIYEWIRLFEDSGHLTSLIPQRRGRKLGSRLLSSAVERIIDGAIQDCYLTRQRRRPQDVVDTVLAQCRTAGIEPPHPNTVRSRLRDLPAATILRRRGSRDAARNRFEPIRGNFPGADFPLAVVQIDHTEADIIVVEEHSRLPMGRPWITLALDVFSRMVVGCYISMEKPSAASVGLCLSRAILPKHEYLASLEVRGEWPVWGRMAVVHADNAREFRGAMLRRACQQYGIDLQMRPVKLPHYGGHIERLMGTSSNEIRKLPGATFSSPAHRKGYDSEKEAALTLEEFERYLVDFIVNVYHQRLHAELTMPPRRRWEIGIWGDGERTGTSLPDVPGDPDRIRLDFLPFVERTVQPYGLVIDDVYYYDEVLNRWISAEDLEHTGAKRSFIVRRDPRDISRVYFYDPEAEQYFTIPYRDTARPPVSVWELRAARQRLKEEGRRHVDENALFEAVARLRQQVEEAVLKTKAARRQFHRIGRATKAGPNRSPAVPLPADLGYDKVERTLPDDIFVEAIQPFDDLGNTP
jgi:putative transposase